MRHLVAATLFVIVLGSAGAAQAYPQWQFSSGSSRCSQCHYGPAGGGLVTSYGRDAAGESLATFGGDGNFLHGYATLPSWLALGGDLRGAFVTQDVQDPSGPTVAAFPMQAEAQARANVEWFSFYAVAGYRGQARSSEEPAAPAGFRPASTSRFVSREHYVMLRPAALGAYVRAGRFFAPFGLRFAEHVLYVRRDLGLGTLEETYNLSGGYVLDKWELHATAFAPDFIRHLGSREWGFSVYLERRFADVAAAALQARVATGPDMTREIAGAVGKYWIEPLKTLLLAEANFVRREIGPVPSSHQIVAAAGLSVLPVPGIMATALQERNQVDLAARDAAFDATTLLLSWFPYAHVEVQAMGRLQYPAGTATAKTLFLQLHYFL